MSTLLAVNNYYYRRGGAETVFFEHNSLFEELGWQVVPFAMQHPRNLPSPWSGHFVEEIEFDSQYSFAQKLRRVPKVIFSLEARRRIDTLVDLVRPDICHAHNVYHHISPSILGQLHSRGVPTVLTLHDLKIACPAYRMLNSKGICERCRGGAIHNVVLNRCVKESLVLSGVAFLEAALHGVLGTYRRHVTRFVVPSRFYLRKFVEWGLPESQFVHVPNFIDTQQFVPAFTPGKAFVFAGRLSSEKGVATLVRAAALASAQLKIAGTGPELPALQQLAAELGADVEFLGHLDSTALRATIAASRAVVVPSEWYENAPMAVLEAYALGKPVIGSRIGGIPELVRNGETGETFDAGDSEALAAQLAAFSAHRVQTTMEMGRAGRDWIEKEFSASRYRERMLALYGEILGRPLAGQRP